jgi:hypothetical protein
MTKVRTFITVGIPGARMDFVAGWIGSLPSFIDSQWRVDPETGRSFGFTTALREVDKDNITVEMVLNDLSLELDPDSDINLSVSLHGFGLENKIHPTNLDAVTIIRINTDQADREKIFWEFLVKTYLVRGRWQHAYAIDRCYYIDTKLESQGINPTNETRQKFLLDLINQFPHKIQPLTGLPIIDVDYNELFQPGGSWYLANRLGLTEATVNHHKLWDSNLQFASSPDVVEKFGCVWNRKDYFNRT